MPAAPSRPARSRMPAAAAAPRPRVCVATISGAHGVRGLVRIKSFTEDPAAFADYGPLEDEAGRRRFAVTVKSTVKGQFLAEIDGIADRDAAQALAGTTLWVDRDRLPAPEEEDEYYHADLLGLPVELSDGRVLGTVRAVYDFGAGDVLEVARPGAAPVVIPFTREAVPVVDIPARRIVVDPPPGLLEPEAPPTGTAEDGR